MSAKSTPTPTLLPCPFCGHAAKLFHDTSSDYERQWSWSVECCNAGECEATMTGFARQEAAIAKWNTRHVADDALTQRVAALEAQMRQTAAVLQQQAAVLLEWSGGK